MFLQDGSKLHWPQALPALGERPEKQKWTFIGGDRWTQCIWLSGPDAFSPISHTKKLVLLHKTLCEMNTYKKWLENFRWMSMRLANKTNSPVICERDSARRYLADVSIPWWVARLPLLASSIYDCTISRYFHPIPVALPSKNNLVS